MSGIQQQILLLSPAERLQLVQYILDTIRVEAFSQPEGEHTQAQMEELSRRLKSIDAGTAEFHTWDEIKSQLGKA